MDETEGKVIHDLKGKYRGAMCSDAYCLSCIFVITISRADTTMPVTFDILKRAAETLVKPSASQPQQTDAHPPAHQDCTAGHRECCSPNRQGWKQDRGGRPASIQW